MRAREAMPPEPTDHETWRLIAWLQNNWAWLIAGMLCMTVALLRAYLDQVKITGRDIAESVICGIFVAVSKPVMGAFGIDDSFALFAGAVIGFLGARFIRPLLEAFARGVVSSRGGKGNG